MNSYLLESNDYIKIEEEIKKIREKEKFLSSSISYYDLEENSLENAIEDLDTYNFLSEKKTIIIKNIEVLKYEDNKKNLEHLLKYIKSPSIDKLLIICSKKLNNTLKLTKELKKVCKYIELEMNPKHYIKEELKDYKLNQDVINLIDEYSKGDFTKIKNECAKLKNYKYEEKEITKEDVVNLVIKKLGDPQELTFQFARSVASKDKINALKEYRELLGYNIEPLSIIGLLASQIRIMYQVKILDKKNSSNREIANILGEKEFRVKKTRELIYNYTEKELLKLIENLSKIDLKVKTTDTNPNREIELFIINLE